MTTLTPAIITCSAHYHSRFTQAWQRLNPGGDECCSGSVFWFNSVYPATAKLIQLIKTASRVIWVVELDNLDQHDMQVFNSLALLNEATVVGVLVHPFAEVKKRLALASGCPQVVDIAGMTQTIELIRRDAQKNNGSQPDPTLIESNVEALSSPSAAASSSSTALKTKPAPPISGPQKQEQQDTNDAPTFSRQDSQDLTPTPQPAQTKPQTTEPQQDPETKPPPDEKKPTSVTLSREELDTLLGD